MCIKNNKVDIFLIFIICAVITGCAEKKPVIQINECNEEKADFSSAESFFLFMQGITLEKNGEYKEALSYFGKAFLIDPLSVESLKGLSRCYLELKMPEEATIKSKKAMVLSPDDPEIFLTLGESYFEQGMIEEALKSYQKYCQILPQNINGHWRLAQIYENMNKIDEAITEYIALDQNSPDNPAIYNKLALLFSEKGNQEEALRLVDKALLIEPQNPKFILLKALIFEEKGDLLKALDLHMQALSLKPASKKAWLRGFELAVELEKNEIALNILEKYIAQFPDDHIMRMKLSILYYDIKDYEKALSQLNILEESKPENGDCHYLHGKIMMEKDDKITAASEFEKALELIPENPEPWIYRALIFIYDNQSDIAEAFLKRALTVHKNNGSLNFLLGYAYSLQKKYNSAKEYYLKALENDYNDKENLYYNLGSVCERLGETDQAAKNFRKTLELNNDNPEALNYLGYMFADLGINLEESLSLILKAVKLEPENGFYLDSLGWVYFKMNEYEKARNELENALKYVNNDPVLYDHLGEVYKKMGEDQKAKESWQKSFELDSGNENVLNKIENIK